MQSAVLEDDFAAWFRLIETPGIGRGAARRLLAACGSPAAVLASHPNTLRRLAGNDAAAALARPSALLNERLAAALSWLSGGPDRHAITLDHPLWPPLLLQTADPPLLLYVQGDPSRLAAASMAVVGSRHPTAQGIDNARAFAAALGPQGFVVVSGLALGIDAAAHEGALQTAAGTVAVVGCGLDLVYPPRHAELARRIAAHGALVSEYGPGTPPLASNFPQRNRIIAGLSQGTLVVEAALRSGSLITARLATEAGREVFAVPGSIHAPQSKGCHALIKQGAKMVETVADIVEELRGWSVKPALKQATPKAAASVAAAEAATPAAAPADPLLEALGGDPVTLDALIDRTGWPVGELSARLLELELDGLVGRLPGGLFQRRYLA